MNFNEIKDKIYPWIKVVYESGEAIQNSTKEIETTKDQQPLMQPWLGNLAIFYAFDEGNHFQLLQKKDLPIDLTIEELHSISINNLQRDIEYQFMETGFGGYGLVAGGDHEAGALCLENIWAWCAEQIQSDLIVAIPAKDLILMVDAKDTEKTEALKSFVEKIFTTGERLLTKQLYHYSKTTGKWTVFKQS